uniref:Uncharacterized protein n=1 Tax=Globodera rostochiensis TaxID=31243 RepID=A0A914HGW4_GLORO
MPAQFPCNLQRNIIFYSRHCHTQSGKLFTFDEEGEGSRLNIYTFMASPHVEHKRVIVEGATVVMRSLFR